MATATQRPPSVGKVEKSTVDALEDLMKERPSADKLQKEHILKADPEHVSPSLHSAVDQLESHFEHRADHNKDNKKKRLSDVAADSLQPTMKEMEMQMRRVSLKRQLENRPDIDELVQRSILHDPKTHGNVQQAATALEREKCKDKIASMVAHHHDTEAIEKAVAHGADVPADADKH